MVLSNPRMANSWRENLKSGPLQRLYLLARNTKRRLRGESLAGTVPLAQSPLSVEELRALAGTMPDHARLYYSLGLGYLDAETHSSAQMALACFRCAEALAFESPERIALYKALVLSRRGQAAEARLFVESLDALEMTEAEARILSDITENRIVPNDDNTICYASEWHDVGRQLAALYPKAGSLLVIGDLHAVSAEWLPQARYMLIEPEVTGLTIPFADAAGLRFDVGIARPEQQEGAQSAGIICINWLSLG